MGHGKKKKKGQKSNLSLHQQAYQRFHDMLKAGAGQSKAEDKKRGMTDQRIYAASTFKTYMRQIDYFIDWLKVHHPEIDWLKKARPFVKEYLEFCEQSGRYSAYTMQLKAKALGKYYGIKQTDKDYYTPPVRHREDIKRSRRETKSDKHFSVVNNDLLIKFARGTGLRRAGLLSIKPDCLYQASELPAVIASIQAKPEAERTEKEKAMLANYPKLEVFQGKPNYYIVVREKGGKWRYAPIIGKDEKDIVDKIKATPDGKRVWEHINKNADIHGYRSDYAAALYKMYARDIDKIPYDGINKGTGKRFQSDVYVCRGECKGKKLDKRAMLCVEKALGHEDLHTFNKHYSHKV